MSDTKKRISHKQATLDRVNLHILEFEGRATDLEARSSKSLSLVVAAAGARWSADQLRRCRSQLAGAEGIHELVLVLSSALSNLPTESTCGSEVERTIRAQAAPECAGKLHDVVNRLLPALSRHEALAAVAIADRPDGPDDIGEITNRALEASWKDAHARWTQAKKDEQALWDELVARGLREETDGPVGIVKGKN